MPTDQTTLITAAGTANSPDKDGCPGVHRVTGNTERFVITREVDDLEVLDALAPHVGYDARGRAEHVGAVPPWVPCGLMSLPVLRRFMEDHMHQAGDNRFRLETLPLYDVSSDPSWRRWCNGATEPDWGPKQAWLDELAADSARDVRHYRVRRFGAELTEYESYACHWGYALNEPAGENIRVLRDGEHDIPDELLGIDYWVVNGEIAVPMIYDAHGRFVGAGWLGPAESEQFIADQSRLWAAAEPFGQWWARHPDLHRRSRTAA